MGNWISAGGGAGEDMFGIVNTGSSSRSPTRAGFFFGGAAERQGQVSQVSQVSQVIQGSQGVQGYQLLLFPLLQLLLLLLLLLL